MTQVKELGGEIIIELPNEVQDESGVPECSFCWDTGKLRYDIWPFCDCKKGQTMQAATK